MTMLFHKILGNEDNPSLGRLTEAKESIQKIGLIAQMPDEWKHLLPDHLQSTPVVWLIGYDRMIIVKKNLLDKKKLFRLDSPEVDWWVYADNIPPEAIRYVYPNESDEVEG